ncbi:MAG: methyltransferase, partial [Candidatus Eisenbacteria bacterium]|nr:methyltransferase [Candidatus Eisenbacteria bacterium]
MTNSDGSIGLRPSSPQRSQELRSYFREAGFTSAGMRDRLGIWSPPVPRSPAYDRVRSSLTGSDPLALLGRLFLLHDTLSDDDLNGLPQGIRALLFEVGLLEDGTNGRRSPVLLAPFGSLYLVSDPLAVMREAEGTGDESSLVLGINPVGHSLLRFTRRDPVARTLDLGAGNGIQGLAASRHSGHVWLTDINERAAAHTTFNAWLNGIDNVSVLVGDTFLPVEGQTFDLIVCNPPFVLTPASDLVCYGNQVALDGFCRELVRQAPAFLTEDGCFQMVFEWVEVEGQPWEARISEWLAETACDAWIYRANTMRPEAYIDVRRDEMKLATPRAVPTVEEWAGYFREHGVRAVHGGLLLLRNPKAGGTARRLRMDELVAGIDDYAGAAISSTLRRADFLSEHRERLRDQRLELNPKARLRQEL